MVVDRTVVVVAGGGPVQVDRDELVGASAVIAADVGVAEARRLGLRVDLLVGDLDSASQDDVRWVETGGGTIRRHPQDKDAIDLELALDEAVARRAERILVLGGADGRLDHTVGNVLVLAARRFARVRIDARFGTALLHVIHDRRELRGRPGELISLFALGGPAQRVRTTGLRWPLDGDELLPGSSRGTSNEFVGDRAVVEVGHGVVLAVRPGEGVPR